MRPTTLILLLLLTTSHALPAWFPRWGKRAVDKREAKNVLDAFHANELYAAIGAKPKATPEQLKKAYKATAKKIHPDKNRDERAASAFDAARDAYDLLSEPMARAQYDEQRQHRLREKRKQKASGKPLDDDGEAGVVGKLWRRKGWFFMAWVVVKTLLA
mmetsp:Transcript_21448/g.64133  ORF Transcript_21448/g.64133 Transcript_21448/m.64133 type:complete len:159 (+) Transcript_21448:308-784(+)